MANSEDKKYENVQLEKKVEDRKIWNDIKMNRNYTTKKQGYY